MGEGDIDKDIERPSVTRQGHCPHCRVQLLCGQAEKPQGEPAWVLPSCCHHTAVVWCVPSHRTFQISPWGLSTQAVQGGILEDSTLSRLPRGVTGNRWDDGPE